MVYGFLPASSRRLFQRFLYLNGVRLSARQRVSKVVVSRTDVRLFACKQPQAVSEVLVSKTEYGFLPAKSIFRALGIIFRRPGIISRHPAGQPVSKVLVSGAEVRLFA
jgi:hypothetical protein